MVLPIGIKAVSNEIQNHNHDIVSNVIDNMYIESIGLKVLVAYNFNISFIGASTNIPVDGIFIAFTIAGIWATWNCDINSRDKGGK